MGKHRLAEGKHRKKRIGEMPTQIHHLEFRRKSPTCAGRWRCSRECRSNRKYRSLSPLLRPRNPRRCLPQQDGFPVGLDDEPVCLLDVCILGKARKWRDPLPPWRRPAARRELRPFRVRRLLMKLAWIRSNHILHIGAKARKCVGCRCMTLLRFSFTQKLNRAR